MGDPKVVQLIHRLRALTDSGNARWTKTAEEGAFNLSFSEYSMQVSSVQTWEDNESYEKIIFKIFDSEGELVEEITSGDLDRLDFGPESPGEIFKSIYSSARRTAMGMDKAISSILDELPEVDEPTVPLSTQTKDDDIPF